MNSIPIIKNKRRIREDAPEYGDENAVIAKALDILAKRMRRSDPMTSPDITRSFLTLHFAGHEEESFVVLYLDNQNRLIAAETLFLGTIDGASVYPRVVVKAALHHNAAAVVFAHNHPSGQASPSEADRRLTERLKAALQTVDVRVLDHFVIGGVESYSFAEHGLI